MKMIAKGILHIVGIHFRIERGSHRLKASLRSDV